METQDIDDDDDDCLADLGFMFDSCHSRATKSISFDKFDVSLRLIDEDPGHVQSGQHLWPGAFYLSTQLCKLWQEGDQFLESVVDIVELGAGCGLCGLVCAKLIDLSISTRMYAPSDEIRIILTDYDPGSLSLLGENIELNGLKAASDTTNRPVMVVEDLKWGDCVQSLKRRDTSESDNSVLVVGSDLIYCDAVIKPLFTTVHSTLSGRGRFLLSFSFDIGNDGWATINSVVQTLGMTQRVLDVSNERNPSTSTCSSSPVVEAEGSDRYSATIIEYSYTRTI